MSSHISIRQAASTARNIDVGVWIAIGVAVGIIIIAAICLALLLCRAIQAHKRLLADLEQRGIKVGQQTEEVDGSNPTKPRAVLRRNTFLPYSTNAAGWNTLPSRESVGRAPVPTQMPGASSTSDLSKPAANRKGWSFSKRSPAPSNIKMGKVRNARLSAIIESPRLGTENAQSSRLPIAEEFCNRASSPKPFPGDDFEASPIERLCPSEERSNQPLSAPDLTKSLRPPPLFWSPAPTNRIYNGPNGARRVRSVSVPSVYGASEPTQQDKANGSRSMPRTKSFTYRPSGLAPDDPVPPLPLRSGRSRSVSNNLEYSPSRRSASSFESATSSILVTTSPAAKRSPHVMFKKGPVREFDNTIILGPRPIRPLGTISAVQEVHRQSIPQHFRGDSIRSSVAQFGDDHAQTPHSRNSSINSNTSEHVKTAESVRMSRPPTRPLSSNSQHERSCTPRRQSRSQVDDFGSPTERSKSTTRKDAQELPTGPSCQLSRASTQASSSRSSGGNPFQWDQSPLQVGKPPSGSKSPDKKKAHRRQNCIRLSLSSTVSGSVSRSERLAAMHNIQEEPDGSSRNQSLIDAEDNLISLDIRPLPCPPSSGVFAPDIRLHPTNLRASLTASSPTLSLTHYGQDASGGSPQNWRHSALSGSSAFSIPTFPSPVHDSMSSQVTFTIPQEDEGNGKSSTDTVRMSGKSLNISSHVEYDPKNPTLCYPFLDEVDSPVQPRPLPEPMGSRPSPPPRHPNHTFDPAQISPPCSPKTLRPNPSLPGTPLKPQGPRPNPSSPRPTSPHCSVSKTPQLRDMDGPFALTAPRTEPGRDVRKTVAALRRMNSDANDFSRSSQRYLMLGREKNTAAGPKIPFRERENNDTDNEIECVGLGIGIALGNESCMSFAELAMTGHASIFGSKEHDEGRDGVTGEDHGFWTSNFGSSADQNHENEGNLSSSIMQTPVSKLAQQTPPPPPQPLSSAPASSSSKTNGHVRKRSHARHNSRPNSRPQSQLQSNSQPQSRAQTPASLPQTPFQKKAAASARHSHHRSKSSTGSTGKKHSYVFVDNIDSGACTNDSDAENRGVGAAGTADKSAGGAGGATVAGLETPAEKRAKRRATSRGVLTPKVQVFVQPPTSDVEATPGSLYDAQGFLK